MRTIVVLEDDDDTRAVMGEVLRVHGYRPVLCVDHFAAYHVIRREQPDLVILDIARPTGLEGGWHLLLMLRGDALTATIPVILYSANVRFLASRRDILAEHGAVSPKAV